MKLPNGQLGEVQVNNRPVLYGKMSKKDFCKASYGIEGGLGHSLYEIWQKNFEGRGKTAADLAKRYYGTLRSFPRTNRRNSRTFSHTPDVARGGAHAGLRDHHAAAARARGLRHS